MSMTAPPSTGSFLMPSLEHATAGDVMHPGILVCEPDAPMSEVARMMATHHIHFVVVVGISHEDPECPVWATISDLDLLRAVVDDNEGATARALATGALISVAADVPLRQTAALMFRHGTSHLIVLEPGTQRPIGVISSLDIAGVLGWGEA